MRKIIGVICLCFFVVCGYAQQKQTADRKVSALFQDAKQAFREGKVEKALDLLDKALVLDVGFSALYLLQADIFNKQQKHDEEIEAIERALALDSLKAHPYYFRVLAGYYFERSDYGKAHEYYGLYLSRDKRLQWAEEAKRQVVNCEFAVEALRGQGRQPTELFYKAERPVYWPAFDIHAKTMLFTEQNGDSESMWMLKDRMRYPLRFRVTGNYGAPSLTANGQIMYFSMNNGRNGFDIYVTYRLTDTTWSEPVNLGYPINTENWDAQPAISGDGSKLYFASNRDGGRGGSDIWFSRLLRQELNGRQVWSQPRCLYFNTEEDEMAPFLYLDNRTLFFASDGYPGMGKKDIYKVDVYEATEPLNVGITVNTCRDEFGFQVDGSGEWGYFSSDADGRRCIYRYHLEKQIACSPFTSMVIGTEEEGGRRISPDRLTLVDAVTGDTLVYYGEGRGGEQITVCVPCNRLLLLNVVKQNYLYYSDTLRVCGEKREDSFIYTARLRRIKEGETLVLKGIYFDTDDYRLKPESKPELLQLIDFLRLNSEVRIEISGHTDDSGDEQHNDQLSESRAFEVYKYLFMNFISKDRMNYKGYGMRRPLAPNDTEEGKARNRRTEIEVRY